MYNGMVDGIEIQKAANTMMIAMTATATAIRIASPFPRAAITDSPISPSPICFPTGFAMQFLILVVVTARSDDWMTYMLQAGDVSVANANR